MNGNLPDGWTYVKLGEAVKIIRGVSFPSTAKGFEYHIGKIAVLRTANVQKQVEWDDLWFVDEKYVKRDEQVIKSNDILISNANSLELLGKVAQVKDVPFKATLGTFISMFRVLNDKNPKFVYFYLSSKEFQKKIQERASTTTNISNVSVAKMETIEIKIAPLPTQLAIVSKLEELFSELDKGIEQLKTAQQQLKTYRQAVLKWAFEGKLTNKNVKEGKLPEGWKWVTISDMAIVETGTTPSKSNPAFYGNDFPFYKPTDLEAGVNVYKSNDGLTKLGLEAARYAPENSTLVTCIGATIGKTGLIKKGGGFNQQINAIVPKDGVNPKFIYYQSISLHFQKQIIDNASATTLPIINKGKFQFLKIVVCSTEEQKKIVSEIESRLGVADKMEESINQSLQQAEALRQSILKKAFEGRLVEC